MTRWRFVCGIVWLAGAVGAWWLTPVGPHAGLPPQVPTAGFLRDGTLVGHNWHDVWLWDEASQRVRDIVPCRDVHLNDTAVVPGTDWVSLWPGKHGPAYEGLRSVTLTLFDVTAGRAVAAYTTTARFHREGWTFAAGRRLAGAGVVDGRTVIDVYSPPAPDRVLRVWDVDGPPYLSPAGDRLACRRPGGVVVFSLPDGRELATLPKAYAPCEFSPDGSMLLDGSGGVWNLATARRLCRVAEHAPLAARFTPAGDAVTAFTPASDGLAVQTFDARTGTPREAARRLAGWFVTRPDGWPAVQFVGDGPVVAAVGLREAVPAAPLRWLATVPRQSRFGKPHRVPTAAVFDAAGRPLWQGDLAVKHVSPDGRTMLAAWPDGDAGVWDVPPRRPWRRVVQSIAVWTAVVAAMAGVASGYAKWRHRRSPSQPL